jgi:signal transduction histidine kinase
VTNSGQPVPEEEIELLTEPFHRFDRRQPGRGAGVGLSIVRAVTTAHGGRLRLEVREEGGLVAAVVLPAIRAEPARAASRDSRGLRPASGARSSGV